MFYEEPSYHQSHTLCDQLIHYLIVILKKPDVVVNRVGKNIHTVLLDSQGSDFSHLYWLGLPETSKSLIKSSLIISPYNVVILEIADYSRKIMHMLIRWIYTGL